MSESTPKNKLVFISDLHIGKNARVPLKFIDTAVASAIMVASNCKPRILIIAGDVTDKSWVDGAELKSLLDIYHMSKEHKVTTLIIEGNHGIGPGRVSLVKALQRIVDRNVWDPTDKYFSPKKLPRLDRPILLIPYGESFEDAVKDLQEPSVIVAHCDVAGADRGSDTVATGVDPALLRELVDQGHIIALGHIHKPQVLAKGKGLAFYVGAPLQFNWGATGQLNRGIYTVDLDTNELECIPLVGGKNWPIFCDVTSKEEAEDLMAKHKHLHLRTKDTDPPEVTSFIRDAQKNGRCSTATVKHSATVTTAPQIASTIQAEDPLIVVQTKYAKESLEKDKVEPYLDYLVKLR